MYRDVSSSYLANRRRWVVRFRGATWHWTHRSLQSGTWKAGGGIFEKCSLPQRVLEDHFALKGPPVRFHVNWWEGDLTNQRARLPFQVSWPEFWGQVRRLQVSGCVRCVGLYLGGGGGGFKGKSNFWGWEEHATPILRPHLPFLFFFRHFFSATV